MTALSEAIAMAQRLQPVQIEGSVAAVRGLTVLVEDLPVPVGSVVAIGREAARDRTSPARDAALSGPTYGEVVGFTREHAIIMLLGQTTGIRIGDPVIAGQAAQTVAVGRGLLGRCVDGLGRPIDGLDNIIDIAQKPIAPDPLRALQRRRIKQPLYTGVRAIDLMTTLGRGQRLGIFAGPGVGKSTLLGTIARRTNADVNVIALIGERGREVKDFIEHSLGPEGLARSVVVVATGDESPLLRIRSAKFACAAAEYFRDAGLDVMLMMDSVTRFAHAQRQVGLAAGEPPATKGYTPSVFSAMALLLERAGAIEAPAAPAGSNQATPGSSAAHAADSSQSGSITGLYTILVEGDDMTEPVADAARGILDGHLILSRKLAQKAHFPAIDVLDSISRVADDVTDKEHQAARRQVLRSLAVYNEVEDLVQIGAYARGSNPEADVAIEHHPAIIALLRQGRDDSQTFEASRTAMMKLAGQINDSLQRAMKARGR